MMRCRYAVIAAVLKWLVLSLFAYVVTAFLVHPNWPEVAQRHFRPDAARRPDDVADRGGDPRHHHQPLSLLLAGVAGGGGARTLQGRYGVRRRRGNARLSWSTACWTSARDVSLQPRHVLHHPDGGIDAARPRQDARSRPRARPPKRCGRSRAISPSGSMPSPSSQSACWRFRRWRARPVTRSAKRCAGRTGSTRSFATRSVSIPPSFCRSRSPSSSTSSRSIPSSRCSGPPSSTACLRLSFWSASCSAPATRAS